MHKLWRMLWAIAKKECLQLSRDRLTAALLISVPIAQVLLFGFAIELAPRHWPGAWVIVPAEKKLTSDAESDELVTSGFFKSIKKSGWLALPIHPTSENEANKALVRGEIRFILYWPEKPSQYLLLDQSVPLKLIGDASDPYVPAAMALFRQTLESKGTSQNSGEQIIKFESPFGEVALSMHEKFSLKSGSGAYLVPALSGVILTLTLTLMAAFALVRERERGTWDGLLSTPAGAGVIIFGKLLPYLGIGLILFGVLQLVSHFLFASGFASAAQWVAAGCFMLGQLCLGACLSLLAKNQMQAMQLGVFFYLPSILLSGFMFPFHAMPTWAKYIGEALPLTHFLRVLRADLFRDADSFTQFQLGAPILLFTALMLIIAISGYRKRVS